MLRRGTRSAPSQTDDTNDRAKRLSEMSALTTAGGPKATQRSANVGPACFEVEITEGGKAPYDASLKAWQDEAAGYKIPVFASFNEPSDTVVAAITPASLRTAILTLADTAEVDAVFVSCTSIRLLDQIESLEADIGLPVTSSNHALIWQTLRKAGIMDSLPGFGRLLQA